MRKVKKYFVALIMLLCLTMISPVTTDMFFNVETVQAAAKMNKSKVTLIKGQALQLKVNGNSKKVKWASSRKNVATVNSKGKVVAKNKGTAVITAKVGKKKYTCKITVKAPKISKTSISLTVGNKYNLKVTGTRQKVKWSSSNKKVAMVLNNGLVVAKKAGTAKITAKVGNKKYTCKVTIKKRQAGGNTQQYVKSTPTPAPKPIRVEKIAFENNEVNIRKDQNYKLNIVYTPENAVIDKNIEWISDNTKIAIVKDGIINPIDVGVCIITAKYGEISTTCTVTVENDKQTLKQLAKDEYDERVKKINKQADEMAESCDKEITAAKRQGCYSGTASQYNAEVGVLNKKISTLKSQIAALNGTTNSSGIARLAKLKADLKVAENQKEELSRRYQNSMTVESMERLKNSSEQARKNSLDQAYSEYQTKLNEIDNLY